MTTDDKEERMNSVDDNEEAIIEAVRDVLCEVIDEVDREVNRISSLRSLAQQIMDVMIRDATNRSRYPGSGDTMQRRSWKPHANVHHDISYKQSTDIAQGLMNRNMDDHEATGRIKQTISRSRSINSLITQSSSHTGYITVFDYLRRAYSMPSGIQMQSPRASKEDLKSQSDQVEKSDPKPSVKEIEAKQHETNCFPKYDIVNTLNTPHGEITVYANGELEDTERIRILRGAVKILKAREEADSEEKDNGKQEKNDENEDRGHKREGFFARAKTLLGQLCCCCCRSSD